jgi:hypothetical protein
LASGAVTELYAGIDPLTAMTLSADETAMGLTAIDTATSKATVLVDGTPRAGRRQLRAGPLSGASFGYISRLAWDSPRGRLFVADA